MDLKPYYKEIASLLRKAADQIGVVINEKQVSLDKQEQSVREDQKQLEKQVQVLRASLAQNPQDDNLRAVKIQERRNLTENIALKEKEATELKVSEQEGIKQLQSLYDQIINEAQSYESRL